MKLIRLFSLLVLMIPSTSAFSVSPGDTGGSTPPFPLHPKPNPNLRPKAPSMQQVSCTYSDGNLHFEFAFPEGQCQLLLSDLVTGETVAAGFDSAASEPVYVGYHSTASLTVTTANGNTYSGNW